MEDSFLKEFSLNKKRKKQKYIFEVHGIVYNSGWDKEYGNLWIECDKQGCDVCQHLGCMGLQMLWSIKALTWKCVLHRPKPPKARTIKKNNENNLFNIFFVFKTFIFSIYENLCNI